MRCWLAVGLLAITLLSSGCAPALAQFWATPTLTAAPTATFTATSTVPPTATVTLAPSSTQTPTPTYTPTPQPLPQLAFSLTPSPVVQGHVVAIRVTASQPVTLTGTLGNQPLAFVKLPDGRYWGLAGIHALAEPGPRDVLIRTFDELGREVQAKTTLEVMAGDYTTENITLPPETAALLDPELVEAELEKLQAMWTQITPEQLWNGVWVPPGGGDTTSAFGTRRSYNDRPATGYHAGQDFLAALGDPVTAPAAGIVAMAEPLTIRGNSVWIDHGLGVYSGYFHLSEVAVEEGQVVKPGDLLGGAGSTGLSTGSHIHWEVRVRGVAVNPLEWTERDIDPMMGKQQDKRGRIPKQ